MQPMKHEVTMSADLFQAQPEQIINLKHKLAQLGGKIDWDFIDGEIAPLYSEKEQPGIKKCFAIELPIVLLNAAMLPATQSRHGPSRSNGSLS